MGITLYKTRYSNLCIEKVEAERFAGKTRVVIDGGLRALRSYDANYFTTFEEAAEFLVAPIRRRAEAEKKRLMAAEAQIEIMRKEMECQKS